LYSGWISGFMVIPSLMLGSLTGEPNGRLTELNRRRWPAIYEICAYFESSGPDVVF
jgi:hypothetical protein